jgi:spermidine synthase
LKARTPTLPEVNFSDYGDIRYLHLGTEWVQGSMRMDAPYEIELEYVQRMMAWLLFVEPSQVARRHAMQLGLGAASLTKFCHKKLRMKTTAIELNPQVAAACRLWFKLPADDARLSVVLGDAAEVAAHDHWRGQIDALQVDLYDHEAAAPVLDSEDFYADCRRLLTEDGAMTVNLFGRSSSYEASLRKDRRSVWRRGCLGVQTHARRQHGGARAARGHAPQTPRAAAAGRCHPDPLGAARAEVAARFQTGADMSVTRPMPLESNPVGPLDWRWVVEWLALDAVISPDEARRTVARCSQAESSQHPLVRLSTVSMVRQGDGKPLDIETLTQWLAGRAKLEYLRIDPLKVDVGRVADAMSANYAERHKVLPVQVTASEVVVATSEPFVTDWVDEVERQSRRSVRRVLASPQDIHRFTAEFYALAKSVRAAQKAGGNAGAASFEQLVELGRSNKAARRQ